MNRKERRAAASADRAGGREAGPDAAFAAALGQHRAGQLNAAERLYREVLAREPHHAAALHFLGVLRHQQGQSVAAVELIEQAIAADGSIPDFHYNLGVILEAMGRRDEAAARYREATALKPDHFGAWLNLGNVLLALGRLEEAEAACRSAARLNPQSGEARYNLGTALARRERYAEAASELAAAARLKPDFAAAHASLGAALLAAHEPAQAAPHLRRALGLDPRHLQAAVNLGQAALAQGDEAGALEAALAALAIGESREATVLFARAARHAAPRSDDRRFRELIARALEEGWDNPVNLIVPAVSLIRMNPAVKAVLERLGAPGTALGVAQRVAPVTLEELIAPATLADLAQDRVLCRLLAVLPPCDADLERMHVALRRALFEIVAADRELPPDGLAVLCAVARQCFVNEYVSGASDEERRGAAALGERLTAALAQGANVPPQWVAAIAAYRPLASLPGAERLVARTDAYAWPAPVAELLVQQVVEPQTENELCATLPRLTAIEDGVSRAVKQQYEENPYPRWISAGPAGAPMSLDGYLQAKFPGYRPLGRSAVAVLVAGCGTGQHAIETAQRFADADVLAIDLSESSLAYARRKTGERGLMNLRYAAADILAFDGAGQTFDLIEASGVLHHLADPFAAWRRLIALLRPGGVMNVGLYSESGRADVVRARAFVAAHGFATTPDGIRDCRAAMLASDDPLLAAACRRADFYSLSGCRDLLFHVEEHRLSLPEIAAFIEGAGLAFLGFDADAALLAKFAARFPEGGAQTDLGCWHAFETENPATFAAMYQFWVQQR
jgi:tetratricopeptide (TPR) repeat protein/SAM-dependent methyltransferase